MKVVINASLQGLSQDDLALIDQFVRSVDSITESFRAHGETYILQGIIWTKPLRCDFQLTSTSALGQAFTGPQLPLEAKLFHRNLSIGEDVERARWCVSF